jgi:hypothetical protein
VQDDSENRVVRCGLLNVEQDTIEMRAVLAQYGFHEGRHLKYILGAAVYVEK